MPNTKRYRPRRTARRHKSLMSTAWGPWVTVLSLVLAAGAALAALVIFVAPWALDQLGVAWRKPEPTPVPTLAPPTPPPNPMQTIELAELQKEIVPDVKFVSDPYRFGDEVLYTGGIDEAGGPKNTMLYVYDLTARTTRALADIALTNDDFFEPQMNETWLVCLDHKRKGGGKILAQARAGGETFVVKEYFVGKPTVTLAGDLLAWTERTGSRMDKVFLYNLKTQENVCVETLENSPFGPSACSLSATELVWANYGASASSEDSEHVAGSVFALNLATGRKSELTTGAFVYNPVTSGGARAWIDEPYGENAALYLSVEGAAAQKLATGVTNYALGKDFIVYTLGSEVHLYVYGARAFDRVISLPEEACILSGVSGDTIFWFDSGNNGRDILKYAAVVR